MNRLDKQILRHLPAALELKTNIGAEHAENRIVHLGVGAFHRAHQALYTDKVTSNWRITGASLRSESVRQQLAPQDYLYTVVERENDSERYRLVQTIDEIIVAPQQQQCLIDAMASESCKIVSLTITEKGYCHYPSSGRLDTTQPDIQHDLGNLSAPRTAPGFIVAALQQRRDKGLGGLTILSCDNLPANGQLGQQVIFDFATELDSDLAKWICEEVSFPSSMVDRIVPATTDADRMALSGALGYRDEAMVVCEPFTQWVIEDNFVRGRPPWEKAGATFVTDVHSFETMKLRLLNGSHSSMAYLGFLAGYDYIYQVAADENFAAFVSYLMNEEITPTLVAPAEIDLSDYKAQLLQRFSNTALKHLTRQIAMDGSQKLPQRLLQTIEAQLQQGGAIEGLCLAVAGWICYTRGIDENGQYYEVDDPLADKLKQHHDRAGSDSAAIVREILFIEEVFPEALRSNKSFVEVTRKYVASLMNKGAVDTVAEFVAALKV